MWFTLLLYIQAKMQLVDVTMWRIIVISLFVVIFDFG
jgi:hypothetical protein